MFQASRSWLMGLAVLALALGACVEGGKKGSAAPAKAAPAKVAPVGKLDPTDGTYRLTLELLPAPVRETFEKQAAGNPMRGFSSEMRDGKPTYDCDVFINGKKNEVIVDADGKLLSTPINAAEAAAGAKSAKKEAGKPAKADKKKAGRKRAGGKKARGANAAPATAEFRDEFSVDKTKLSDRGNSEYCVLQPGYRLIYSDGKDTLTITVLDETKMVDGVKTRVIEERETKDLKLAEVSRNWFAIDKATGDLYYFGESVDMYDPTGKVTGHEGGWEAGVDGAKFGLGLPGKPVVGDKYCQEVAPKVAMDRAEVVSITETAKVPAGEFKNCLKTKESSALEAGTGEKIYAPDTGLIKDDEFELVKKEIPLPDAVSKAFKAAFPKGEIEKLDIDEENGVMVYDFEFKNGAVEQETDIAGDGTILETTLVVEAKDVPQAAMKAIEKAAGGGKLTRIEKIDIQYETKDGKAVKLAKPIRHFAVEYEKGGQSGEVVVTPDGAPVEE